MAYKGKYYPKNPEKYVGDPDKIIYRSTWERDAMIFFDQHSGIIYWSSEECAVPYYDPIAKKKRRYFPDFIVKTQGKDGNTAVFMIEVKPLKQCSPPEKKKRVTKRYVKDYCTYKTNEAKWIAAKKYCEEQEWKFMLITENNLGMFKL